MRVVVDSSCELTDDMKSGKTIAVDSVPYTLQLGDRVFIDDEALNINTYLENMADYKGTPRTAAPSPESYFDKFKQEGAVFAVTISSKLSASYNNAILAKDMYLEEMGNKFIHVFDSLSASIGQTLVVMKLDEFIKKKLPEKEIVENVDTFISGMKGYFILEHYDNLVKNGRMKSYVAKVASFLSIKPICNIVDGNLELMEKARGYKNAITKLIDSISKEKINFENRILGISHVANPEKAKLFKDEIMKKIKFKDVIILPAHGLCSTYADRDGLIVGF